MLITYTGRKSGMKYSIPVNYVQDGNVFLTTSLQRRKWWRNLRGGTLVRLRLRGDDVQAKGLVIEEPKEVAKHLGDYLRKVPQHADIFGVSLDQNEEPDPGDLAKSATIRVIVRFQLSLDETA